jgi:hypothetical protein
MSDENQEWQAPPPPEEPEIIQSDVPQMSEASSLINIFFEPGRTFEYLRAKPKFLMAGLVLIILTTVYQNLLISRLGEARIRRAVVEQLDKNPQIQSMPPEQKQKILDQQMTISSIIGKYLIPVFIIVFSLLLALLYWVATNAMGGSSSFLRSLSVVFYSSLPPAVIGMVANIIILFVKDLDEIDISTAARGLVHANPSILFDGKTMPVLTTLISTLDVFQIWGWILAAIGIKVMGKISTVSAWTVVLIFALVGITFRVVMAVISGNPN